MFQLNRLAIDVAEILQALLERAQIWRFFFGVSRVPQNADSRDAFALLRPHRERPPDRRTNQAANKFPTPHSITSSAWTMIDCGMVMPSALAVLRLITSF